MHKSHPGLMRFVVVRSGQFASLLGSAMTWFALKACAYQVTGQATALALIGSLSFGPTILLSPAAGALVDRWSRKPVLVIRSAIPAAVCLYEEAFRRIPD